MDWKTPHDPSHETASPSFEGQRMVPNLRKHQLQASTHEKKTHSPKSRLNTSNIILPPISPSHLLLPNRNAVPIHAHHRHSIALVLIESNIQSAVMPLHPLPQSPLLHDFRRLLQFDKLPADITAKELEFTADMGTFKHLRRGACEGGEPVGGGKGGVEFGCGRAKLLRGIDARGVDGGAILDRRHRRPRG